VLATGYAEAPAGESASLWRLARPFTQATLNAIISEAAFDEGASPERRATDAV
jgi:hypothetical protein